MNREEYLIIRVRRVNPNHYIIYKLWILKYKIM